MTEQRKDLRLAVLIDADNVPSSNLKEMLEEIAKYGTPTFKRIYADWTNPYVERWKVHLLENSITPIQQYAYTRGKNSSDSAMIIDAMDILYSGNVDGFCIVSSDSDFTRLAVRLREAGMKVIGIGQKKTPKPFITACDKFIYIEILKPKEETAQKGKAKKKKEESADVNPVDVSLIRLLTATVNDLADEDGWALLSDIGNLILKKKPDFDARNYGFAKLLPLIKSAGRFEVEERDTTRANVHIVYVRVK